MSVRSKIKKKVSKSLGKSRTAAIKAPRKQAKIARFTERLTTPVHNPGVALKDSFKMGVAKRFDKLTPAQKKRVEANEKSKKRTATARKIGKAVSKPITKVLKKVKARSDAKKQVASFNKAFKKSAVRKGRK